MRQYRLLLAFLMTTILMVLKMPLSNAAIDARLLRFPDVSADKILFTYASDLWIAPLSGGRAYRLTSDGGSEKRGKFSPDGTQVAYSATYQENRNIFTLDVEGGIPKQVTYHPDPMAILDWSADGKQLLFASTMYSERPRYNKLFLVNARGGLPEQLPLFYGETAALSADGSQLIYTFYKDFQEESWKRYEGGRAPDLWLFDKNTGISRKLTDYVGPDSQPMWAGDMVYYLSENGAHQRSNIWALDLMTGAKKQITHFIDYDVRHPSIGPSHIVFQQADRLYLLSLADNQVKPIDIDLVIDQQSLTEKPQSVEKRITSSALSADAKAVYFEARGDIFKLDAEHGVATNLTQTPGIAERYPSPSPDGQSLAYFSDQSGEYQLVLHQLNSSASKTLTHFTQGYRYRPQWSPDSKKIAFIDNEQVLRVIDVKSAKMTVIDKGLRRGHYELENFQVSWSADSLWLAFSRHLENLNQAIFLYEVASKKLTQATSGDYNDFDPVFDPQGNYLYLLSHRQFSPIFGDIDETWTYANSTTIGLIPLRLNTLSPFHPGWRRLEVSSKVEIDLADFENRLVLLPLKAGRYVNLSAVPDKLIYQEQPTQDPDKKDGAILKYYDLTTKTESNIIADVSGFELSHSGEKILLQKDEVYGLVEVAKDQELKEKLATANLIAAPNLKAEYRQMVSEAKRYVRDFFYDPGIHGLDWPAVVDSYRRWLPYVNNEEDMTVLLTELAAELSGGHIWATAADSRWRPKNETVGLLGVDFEVADNAYRIKKIYASGAYADAPVSPLAAPGLNVKVGDYLLAVNGTPLSTQDDPWKAFQGQFEKVVRLSISHTPKLEDAREILVKTIASEQKLRELDWVASNRKKVAQASDGKLGYLYLPDTSLNGQNDLMRQFRAQFHKQGLIIDERFNMGGALGDRLVELLNRPPLNYFSSRNAMDYALPTIGHNGPKSLITNGWSYSGGDGFPFLFKTAQLGPLIGTQTWGGLIGPNLPLKFINGGAISAPPQRVYDIWGHWAEGNEGVRPDIVVENDPTRLYFGEDAQLDRAISETLKALETHPIIKVPEFPSARIRR